MAREISIAFQTDKRASEYIDLAKQVNQYAFDVVSVYCDAPYHPSYGPLLLMAPYIQHARIGPAAVSPSRMPPLDIASQTALLSELAAGGVYIGLARGAWLADHGIDEVAAPIQSIRETVDIIAYLLTGQSGGYSGRVHSLASHVKATYPIPAEVPPIMIGTWGKKLCSVAGEIADEVKVGGSANPDIVPVIKGYIAEGEQVAGREPDSVGVVVGAVCVVDEDRQVARQAARRSVALYLPVVAGLDPTIEVEQDLLDRVQACVNRHAFDDAAALISDNLLDRFAFSGNPDDIVRQCELLFDAGANRVELGTPHGLKPSVGIDLIGQKVIPNLSR